MKNKPIIWVVEDHGKKNVFWPSPELKEKAWASNESIYKESAKDPVAWWAKLAREGITWYKEWTETYKWDPPFYQWFIGAKLNISYNALDRHINSWERNKAAIIWEPEPPSEPHRVLTYYDLYQEVNKFANILKRV